MGLSEVGLRSAVENKLMQEQRSRTMVYGFVTDGRGVN